MRYDRRPLQVVGGEAWTAWTDVLALTMERTVCAVCRASVERGQSSKTLMQDLV